LEHYFKFVGFQKQVATYLAAIDIGVLPSRSSEGLGLAVLELMAMRIPVVTSSLPCFREVIVDGESGLIASLDRPNELADHLLLLLQDRTEANRIGEVARERVLTHFTIQRLANDMMDLYDRLLDSKKAGRRGGLST
jgi:glycosyltransferase involved in cell wall biosynthesis